MPNAFAGRIGFRRRHDSRDIADPAFREWGGEGRAEQRTQARTARRDAMPEPLMIEARDANQTKLITFDVAGRAIDRPGTSTAADAADFGFRRSMKAHDPVRPMSVGPLDYHLRQHACTSALLMGKDRPSPAGNIPRDHRGIVPSRG